MDKLLFVPDIQARYQVSAPTARKIMRQMIHLESPKLAVRETAVRAYELEREQMPDEQKRRKTKAVPALWVKPKKDENGMYHIPRRRA